jgi:hypothetical protein
MRGQDPELDLLRVGLCVQGVRGREQAVVAVDELRLSAGSDSCAGDQRDQALERKVPNNRSDRVTLGVEQRLS